MNISFGKSIVLFFFAAHGLCELYSYEKKEDYIYTVKPGRYRYVKSKQDAFSKLPDSAYEVFKEKVLSKDIAELKKQYIEMVEKNAVEKYAASAEFIAWLSENKEIRNEFWLALSAKYDNIEQCINIFDSLRKKNDKLIKKYFHLAIAIAVVWDTPEAIDSSRYSAIWGYQAGQFPSTRSYEEVYDYFTSSKYSRYFVFQPHKLRWPLLIHIVDYDITEDETKWALKKYNSKKKKIQTLYNEVKYDYQKLTTRKPAMGDQPYTLQNIIKYNGICGDQSHFSSRIAKSFGIPSMKVTGEGRFGGAGHAWAGYLIAKNRKPLLEFTGRFLIDMYYTGDIFDPQTRTMTLDRYVAMMYEGASTSYTKYIDSLFIAERAKDIYEKDPETSLKLAKYAIQINVFSKPGWDMILKHIEAGNVKTKESISLYNQMLKKLKSHPDMSIKGIIAIMASLPEDDYKMKNKLFSQALPLYAKRPDLQIQLRILQCQSLKGSKSPEKTLAIALKTCLQHTKESSLILPLVEVCVDISNQLGLNKKVKPYMTKIKDKFPKQRGGSPSEAYQSFLSLYNKV